jgi:hypothetical protein
LYTSASSRSRNFFFSFIRIFPATSLRLPAGGVQGSYNRPT